MLVKKIFFFLLSLYCFCHGIYAAGEVADLTNENAETSRTSAPAQQTQSSYNVTISGEKMDGVGHFFEGINKLGFVPTKWKDLIATLATNFHSFDAVIRHLNKDTMHKLMKDGWANEHFFAIAYSITMLLAIVLNTTRAIIQLKKAKKKIIVPDTATQVIPLSGA